MSKKITEQEFLQRFKIRYPDCSISVKEYTAISNPCKIQCQKCGKIFIKQKARDFLNMYCCCGAHGETRLEKILRMYKQQKDFEFVKKVNKDYIIVRHLSCQNEFKRKIQSCLDTPFSCQYCNTRKITNMMTIQEAQQQIDKIHYHTIQILDYNGQLEKNHYKCLKCGLIFTQQHTCLLQSRGCPKCDKWKSAGEKQVTQLLASKNINYKEQVSVEELPLQHFDFGVYDNNNNLCYFIEVQGEQHFEKREIFRDSLEKIQERDNRKREYCKKNNIPLYELIYIKGKIKNLDILPF